MTENKMNYIDLFAGCGGLSLGLYNSGAWKGVFAIEKSPDAFETLKFNLIENRNHFDWPEWLPKESHDINTVLKKYKSQLKSLINKIDLVAGGPPCQGFSTAGKRYEGDSRNELINSYIKFIRTVQPKMIFFENVKGFTQQFDKNKIKGKQYSEYVKNALSRDCRNGSYIGYRVYGKLIDFSEYGVPQKRTRFILVGVRKDLANSAQPELFFETIKQNKEKFLVSKNLGITTSLEEAISDLVKIRTSPCPDFPNFDTALYNSILSPYQQLMRSNINSCSLVPDSHRFANHKVDTLKRFEYILNVAEKNKTLSKSLKEELNLKKRTVIPVSANLPAPTLTTLPDDYLHYSEPRIFTVREYARIQSFSDCYEFKGKYTTGGEMRTKEVPRYSQIGNAIPPLFAEQAGISLLKILQHE